MDDEGHHPDQGNWEGDVLDNVIPENLIDHPAVMAFLATEASFLITNPRLPGNPIVYASPGFLELTGYPIDRILGRNCRFLQGPETNPLTVSTMREAIDDGKDIAVTLLNYRLDGSTFWNRVLISSVHGGRDGSELQYFLGVQHRCEEPNEDGPLLSAG